MLKIALIVLALISVVSAQTLAPPPAVQAITLQTNATGYASEETRLMVGEVLGLEFINGNFTARGIITIKDTRGVQLDSYNVSNGTACRLPGIKILGSSDAWGPYVVSSPLWLNMSGQEANKTAKVLIVCR